MILFKHRKIKRFSRQLAMLLEAGITFPTSLELIAKQQRSRRWRNTILGVSDVINRGESFTEAVRRSGAFSKEYKERKDVAISGIFWRLFAC